VILSDLEKHSVTRSIAWPLCDSWASCSFWLFTVDLNRLRGSPVTSWCQKCTAKITAR